MCWGGSLGGGGSLTISLDIVRYRQDIVRYRQISSDIVRDIVRYRRISSDSVGNRHISFRYEREVYNEWDHHGELRKRSGTPGGCPWGVRVGLRGVPLENPPRWIYSLVGGPFGPPEPLAVSRGVFAPPATPARRDTPREIPWGGSTQEDPPRRMLRCSHSGSCRGILVGIPRWLPLALQGVP